MVRAIRTNDTTQLAFCSRLERLNVCSLHPESCSCGVTEKPPELLDEKRARALSTSHLLRGYQPGSITSRSQHCDANCTIRTLYWGG